MPQRREPLDLLRLRVFPVAERRSLTRIEDILLDPDAPLPSLPEAVAEHVRQCADQIIAARDQNASVLLIYGAHLLRNGAAVILERMMRKGWLTHLATNGAGTIHDWEFAWLGRSSESVADNVAIGSFGTWDETGRNIHIALLAGSLAGEGYGRSLGRFIWEDGATLPETAELERDLCREPRHPLAAARADLLRAMTLHNLPSGLLRLEHRSKHASILAQAFRHGVMVTVHPGIGYDIVANHPMFSGAVIGRAADVDFRQFGAAVDGLDGGVVLSVGSAIMGPQVFEKSLSCVNNLRLQDGRPIVKNHTIYVVDLQDGGRWDWSQGEPPKSSPAYYLRFCKSYSRMGGAMHYVQCDNALFIHSLYHALREASGVGRAS
jgi:hypothetical protein